MKKAISLAAHACLLLPLAAALLAWPMFAQETAATAAAEAECAEITISPAAEKAVGLDVDNANKPWSEKLLDIVDKPKVCPHCGVKYRSGNALFWITIGFIGQAVFASRFVVQWIASEKRKESYVPVAFWYLSIVGSLLLLVYAVAINAWPIIIGQATGLIPYVRNLMLIKPKPSDEADGI